MSRGVITIVIISLALLLGFVWYSTNEGESKGQSVTFSNSSTEYEGFRAYWSEEMEEKGVDVAYNNFKRLTQEVSFDKQHALAHMMGELIFDTVGVDGITTCDTAFAFGCYHSFFGSAISELGLSIVEELDAACIEAYGPYGTGCQHGIGHGVMEYMGKEKLEEALLVCDKTSQRNEFFGCTSGVFMEYNVPLATTENNTFTTVRRPLDKDKPYDPCDSLVHTKFRGSCIYELPQWWNKYFNFSEIGALCDGLSNTKEQDACFLGVGNVVAPASSYEVDDAISLCSRMPSAKGVRICLSGASWSFFSEPSARKFAPVLCAELPGDEARTCARESDVIQNGEILELHGM